MYDPKYLTIDIFKDGGLYTSLSKHNHSIKKISKTVSYKNGNYYDTQRNEASIWFDYTKIRETLLSAYYPEVHPVQYDPRLSLLTHAPNHIIILLLETLYKDKRDILIEDVCCGMGNLVFYLSKLGFHNFHVVDNFSQLPKVLFERLMKEGNIKYALNDMEAKCVTSSIVAYPHYLKKTIPYIEVSDVWQEPDLPNSLELFLSYIELMPGKTSLSMNNDYFFNELKFRPLCKDNFKMLYVYCKEHKHNEFMDKLNPLLLDK